MGAETLDATSVELNGKALTLQAGDAIPEPIRQSASRVSLAPATITFLSIPNADNKTCR